MTQAQDAIFAGLDFSARSGVKYFDGELLRIKANILDRVSPYPLGEVVALYEQSLAASERIGAGALYTLAFSSLFSFLKHRNYYEPAQGYWRHPGGYSDSKKLDYL